VKFAIAAYFPQHSALGTAFSSFILHPLLGLLAQLRVVKTTCALLCRPYNQGNVLGLMMLIFIQKGQFLK
jgi:hypothetical protein